MKKTYIWVSVESGHLPKFLNSHLKVLLLVEQVDGIVEWNRRVLDVLQ